MKQNVLENLKKSGGPIIDLPFDLDISPTPSLIFTGGQKLQHLAFEVL